MLRVEADVPLPEKENNGGRPAQYPLRFMRVGDSFFAEAKSWKSFSSVNARFKKEGKKFSVRKVEGGVRVWRIA